MENNLMVAYKAWRLATEEANEGLDHNIKAGSIDCGDQAVREDFSNYAELEEEITFEEMLKLENEYEAE